MRYFVTGRRVTPLEAEGSTLAEAVAAFREAHPDVLPESWEDDSDDLSAFGDFVGVCEGCDAMILANEMHAHDPESMVYFCRGCMPTEGGGA